MAGENEITENSVYCGPGMGPKALLMLLNLYSSHCTNAETQAERKTDFLKATVLRRDRAQLTLWAQCLVQRGSA